MSARKKEETAATQEWRPAVEQRPCFTFVRDWYETIKGLPKESRSRLYEALIEFGLDFKEPEFTDPLEVSLWFVLRKQALYGWKKHVAGKGTKKGREIEDFLNAFPDKAKEPDEINQKEAAAAKPLDLSRNNPDLPF